MLWQPVCFPVTLPSHPVGAAPVRRAAGCAARCEAQTPRSRQRRTHARRLVACGVLRTPSALSWRQQADRLKYVPMAATDSLCAPVCVSDRTLVLVLGGWSPGPLDALRRAMRGHEVDFLEPPLHMPPAGIRWCCTWEAVLLACCLWLALFLLTRGGSLPLVQRGALLLASVLALPAAVVLLVRGRVEIKAGLAGQPHPARPVGRGWPCHRGHPRAGEASLLPTQVRGSIRRSIRSARREIERRRVDVVVGFSWGGGVACWLLAERHWCAPTSSGSNPPLP